MAVAPQRRENILCWTRIGEYLPVSNQDQRVAKFHSQMQGVIPDGVLVRISNNVADRNAGLALNEAFAATLLRNIAPKRLPALVGTSAASLIGRHG